MNNQKKEQKKKTLNLCGRMANRDRFEDIKSLINKEEPIIIDGGANVGQMVEKFLNVFDNPVIYAFEPIPAYVEILNQKFENNSRIKIYQKALGSSQNKINFNVLNSRVASSVLRPGSWVLKYHKEKMDIVEKIEVNQIELDEFKFKEIDVIKLDLQGYELEALKGMQKTLSKIKIITTEVEFVPLYENQPLFAEIDIFLRANNFRLLNLYELW